MNIEVKKIENEILRISITEQLRESYKVADISNDLDWVEQEFTNFCTNQQVKKAIMNSVDLLALGDYEGIKTLVNNALKAGQDKNIGHIYDKDVESRYRKDDRNPIPFPWKAFNDLTQGGMGKGDLILLFGNPGGGKSWGLIAIGAYAASLGYNVAHYTLELGEGYVAKRYDSVYTGIDVDKLDENKVKVEEIVSKVRGKVIIKGYSPKRASLDTIESHLQQLEHQHDFKPDIILIDYLDLLRIKKSRKERKEEIDDTYTEAKGLAKDKGIPIVSPSQANRSGAQSDILEGDKAAGSYDKIMIGDMIISLARKRKDKVNGTGRWHWIKNRYGADGLTFGSKINTSNGHIEIYEQPLDDDGIENGNNPSGIDGDDKEYIKNFFKN